MKIKIDTALQSIRNRIQSSIITHSMPIQDEFICALRERYSRKYVREIGDIVIAYYVDRPSLKEMICHFQSHCDAFMISIIVIRMKGIENIMHNVSSKEKRMKLMMEYVTLRSRIGHFCILLE
jgi:hypothetical protein